jgi:hypothetical protein
MRNTEDQYMRLRLLPLAGHILGLSHTLQEYKEVRDVSRGKVNSVWKQREKLIHYYAFIAIINNALIKIIVKQVGNGQMNFHSLIPTWRTKNTNGDKKRITHSGNPEED